MIVALAFGACNGTMAPNGAPAGDAPPAATARSVIDFSGEVDVANRTITFAYPSAPAAPKPDVVTVGYGGGTDRVYLHTISPAYDDGNATGAHPCSSPANVIRICASVTVVNGYPAALTSASAVIDSFTETNVSLNQPFSYGTVPGSDSSGSLQWVFTLPSSTGFRFSGHVTGNVPWVLSSSSLATARWEATALTLSNGKVLLAGGRDTSGNPIGNAELYDPTSGTWSTGGTMVLGRFLYASSFLNDGRVLVSGGYINSSGSVATNFAEIYDPMANTWSQAASLNIGRAGHTQVTLPSGLVLVAGGTVSGTATASAELYDPVANKWTATGSLTTARRAHSMTLLPSGKVLVAAGLAASNADTTSCELYTPGTGTWAVTGSLTTARDSHTATLLSSGKVWIIGGTDNGTYLSSTELYDPAFGRFTSFGSLNSTHAFHTATLMSSGPLLVAGGLNFGSPTAVAEQCDPTSGVCSTTGSLNAARYNHAAALLQSGKVLVVGGSGSGILSSTELYDN